MPREAENLWIKNFLNFEYYSNEFPVKYKKWKETQQTNLDMFISLHGYKPLWVMTTKIRHNLCAVY